ncbi:hypothetical protein NL676_015322 [Syzygium grande]|nr:hypothetical protein NL676_015322 [Syzygium grande]
MKTPKIISRLLTILPSPHFAWDVCVLCHHRRALPSPTVSSEHHQIRVSVLGDRNRTTTSLLPLYLPSSSAASRFRPSLMTSSFFAKSSSSLRFEGCSSIAMRSTNSSSSCENVERQLTSDATGAMTWIKGDGI